jgi:hypothetical protein
MVHSLSIAACERRKSLNHRELKAKLVMGRVSLQTATRYKEPEPESAAESSSDEELILRSELRPGLRLGEADARFPSGMHN